MQNKPICQDTVAWHPLFAESDAPGEVLPIFFQEQSDCLVFYAPGYVVQVENNKKDEFVDILKSPDREGAWRAASELVRYAEKAREVREQIITRSFLPTCLTLYLNNQCNLRCSYCFSGSTPQKKQELDIKAVEVGTKFVLNNCLNLSMPFTVVFHGGGEPLLDQNYANKILNEIEDITQSYDLPVFRYVATNGVMSIQKAKWMAQRFQSIGISCDGPDYIQNQQRPLFHGANSSGFIERTCEVVRDAGRKLFVRVTLTPESFQYQTQIAEYICLRLHPDEIHVEAVYQGGRANGLDSFLPGQAKSYVNEFIKAHQIAGSYGIPWLSSGSRPPEIHGPYCNLYRGVLNLVPGNMATACFKITSTDRKSDKPMMIGRYEKSVTDCQWFIDREQIETLQGKMRQLPANCRDCFNQYHCTYGCPDLCLLDDSSDAGSAFRCETQKLLINHFIQSAIISHARGQESDRGIVGGPVRFDS